MKIVRLAIVLCVTLFSVFVSPLIQPVHAVEPFPPFSKEGNPPAEYYFLEIWPLMRFIKPAQLKIYENRDRSRNYEDLEMCANGDRRDYDCTVDLSTGSVVDECEGGDVDVCYKGVRRGQVAYTAHSGSGSCRVPSAIRYGGGSGEVAGTCSYTQTPRIRGELKATDFSEIMRAAPTTDSTSPDPGATTPPTDQSQTPQSQTALGLIYAKLQNEQLKYGGIGTDNPLTWGMHRLQLTQDEQLIKQLLVVSRAKQTKNTVATTGAWPLGWVDWGYVTPNGKTLIQIHDALPGQVSGNGMVIVEATDDFFLNAGNLDAVSDASKTKEEALQIMRQAASQNPRPEWIADLMQAPVYSPSFRQGYVRGSICVFDLCCPGLYCPFPEFLDGNSRALYADTSVSQAFNAAMDDLLLNYNLKDSIKIFKDLAAGNQLIRFAGSSAPNAIPRVIDTRLEQEITNPCFQYIPGFDDFTFGWFGFYMDYANPPTFLDPKKECPGWAIQPELTKEKGAAIPNSLLSSLVNLIWGHPEDEVSPVKYHLITIPDAMGQHLAEIEDPVFQIRDTLSENEKQNEYNSTISNIVDATGDYYYSGKGMPIGDAKRRLAYFSCADSDYSVPESTGIEAYALGTRIGCFDSEAVAGGKCTSEAFAALVGETNEMPLPEASSMIMSSAMFEGGAMNQELAEVYAQVEEETGVPCIVLAAHHMEESFSRFFDGSDPGEYSGANGTFVGKSGFLESVRSAATSVLRHPPRDRETLITAMSNFNGGGNSNCQTGFPVPIGWGGCPKQFIGDDDPYATNLLDSRHTGMKLLYCADFTICNPPKDYGNRPGAYSIALTIHNAIKGNTSTPTSSASPSPTASAAGRDVIKDIDPAGTCGAGYIDTGLGCLPYERDAFVGALLGFIAGISGLIALGSMMVAVFTIMTTAGDAKKLQKGKELFMAALAGLLFVIFSVTFLRIIAGDIIRLPGF